MSLAIRVLSVLVCFGSALAAGAAEPRHGEFGSESVRVGSATREYRLVAPKTVDLAKPAPLVVAFHGMLIDSKDPQDAAGGRLAPEESSQPPGQRRRSYSALRLTRKSS
jgi:poly(3-hydroxybutyrate) depolymerase